MTDQEISQNLAGSIQQRNQALQALYRHTEYKPRLLAFLKSKGIEGAELNELFNETLIKFSLIVKKGNYEEKGKMLGYLMSIANFLVLDFY
ncbi:MAG TPA: hypothetical protein VJ917_11380, partial [Saprospiraceae bacterium]|nr:hypothetical protein [Saprospiraceae bacterium]